MTKKKVAEPELVEKVVELEQVAPPAAPCAWCNGTRQVVVGMDEEGLVHGDCGECA